MPSELEEKLFTEFKFFGLPVPERQFQFHSTRKWRFDFAWPARRIAVEVQGGIFMRNGAGGHNRGGYMELSYEKMNAAVKLGWTVYQFGPKACKAKSGHCSEACAWLYEIFFPKKELS